MSVKIGNRNIIKKSIIAEKIEGKPIENRKKGFHEKHPAIFGFLISLSAGIVLLFSFWSHIISWIEGWF